MRCLWLTLADANPRTNGQFIYSGGLLDAVAASGAQLDVIGLVRPESQSTWGTSEGSVRHWFCHGPSSFRWTGLASPLPYMALRQRVPKLQRLLDDMLAPHAHPCDAIVFDSLSPAWLLPTILKRLSVMRRRPALIYLAHNHEESLAFTTAGAHPHPVKRQVHRWDAVKVGALETALIAHADAVTAISHEDAHLFRTSSPDKRFDVLPPPYTGARLASRTIDQDTPRRVVIAGSYDWMPKRVNLEEFLAAATPRFRRAGVELQVIGSAEPAFLAGLRRKYPEVDFTGAVDNITGFLAQARLGIVAERVGGGLKLKVLDYAFHGLPIAALSGSINGTPLVDRESALFADGHAELAQVVLSSIDDFRLLNRLQRAAYAACAAMFDHDSIGRQLTRVIEEAVRRATAIRPPAVRPGRPVAHANPNLPVPGWLAAIRHVPAVLMS